MTTHHYPTFKAFLEIGSTYDLKKRVLRKTIEIFINLCGDFVKTLTRILNRLLTTLKEKKGMVYGHDIHPNGSHFCIALTLAEATVSV